MQYIQFKQLLQTTAFVLGICFTFLFHTIWEMDCHGKFLFLQMRTMGIFVTFFKVTKNQKHFSVFLISISSDALALLISILLVLNVRKVAVFYFFYSCLLLCFTFLFVYIDILIIQPTLLSTKAADSSRRRERGGVLELQ